MSACIDWPLYIRPNGYGQVKRGGKTILAHRWVWSEKHGPIPDGAVVMHTCHRRSCVNLDHLQLGSQSENVIASVQIGTHNMTRKTHCPQGHPYSEENTVMVNNGKRGGRRCVTCHRGGVR